VVSNVPRLHDGDGKIRTGCTGDARVIKDAKAVSKPLISFGIAPCGHDRKRGRPACRINAVGRLHQNEGSNSAFAFAARTSRKNGSDLVGSERAIVNGYFIQHSLESTIPGLSSSAKIEWIITVVLRERDRCLILHLAIDIDLHERRAAHDC